MIRAIVAVLAILSPLALADVMDNMAPYGMTESQLYQNEFPYTQYQAGYGGAPSGQVERTDEPVQQLQDIVESVPGQDQSTDFNFPASSLNSRFDLNKEIHGYSVQRRIQNRMDRNFRNYFKDVMVNALYNTNLAKINHAKLINVLNVQSQDIHRPNLKIAFSRQDTVTNVGDRSEEPVVEQQGTNSVLPPIVEPVRVNRLAYDGSLMTSGMGLGMMRGRYYNGY